MTMKMTCSSKKHQKQKGFTVTEVAVVAAIIGVLTIGSISIYSEQKKMSSGQKLNQDLRLSRPLC